MDFNLSNLQELNDVVQRAGIDDRRKRNEMIRQGLSDQGTFANQYSGEIGEARQPGDPIYAGGSGVSLDTTAPDISSWDYRKNLPTPDESGFVWSPDQQYKMTLGGDRVTSIFDASGNRIPSGDHELTRYMGAGFLDPRLSQWSKNYKNTSNIFDDVLGQTYLKDPSEAAWALGTLNDRGSYSTGSGDPTAFDPNRYWPAVFGGSWDKHGMDTLSELSQQYGLRTPENIDASKWWSGYMSSGAQSARDDNDGGFLGGLGEIAGPLGMIASFVPGLQPLGYALSGISALESGNPLGIISSAMGLGGISIGDLFGGQLGLSDVAMADSVQLAEQGLSQTQINQILDQTYGAGAGSQFADTLRTLSSSTGISPQVFLNGGASALNAAITGGNPLNSGLTSGLSALFGQNVEELSDSKGLGRLAGIGASAGLSSLFNKRGISPGQEAINSLTSSYPVNMQTPPQEEKPIDRKTLMDIARQRYIMGQV